MGEGCGTTDGRSCCRSQRRLAFSALWRRSGADRSLLLPVSLRSRPRCPPRTAASGRPVCVRGRWEARRRRCATSCWWCWCGRCPAARHTVLPAAGLLAWAVGRAAVAVYFYLQVVLVWSLPRSALTTHTRGRGGTRGCDSAAVETADGGGGMQGMVPTAQRRCCRRCRRHHHACAGCDVGCGAGRRPRLAGGAGGQTSSEVGEWTT